MRTHRVSLFQLLLQDDVLADGYKTFSKFENGFFKDQNTVSNFYDMLTSTFKLDDEGNETTEFYYSKDIKDFYKSYCCDLEWAKTTTYCKTTPAPPPGPGPDPGPAPGPSTGRYTSVNYSGQDIINGQTIEKGMKGDIVTKIQEHLNRHGASPILVVDGKFWDKTKQAVKDFQKSKQLSSSGVVEDKTWIELTKDKSSTTTPPKPAKDPLEDIYGTGRSEIPTDLFDY